MLLSRSEIGNDDFLEGEAMATVCVPFKLEESSGVARKDDDLLLSSLGQMR